MKRIVLDVDDVLNGLTLHILRHFKCDVGPFEYDIFPIEVGYDVITACQVLQGDAPTDEAEFWDEVTRADLWRTAPKSLQCDWLIETAADIVGRDQVLLATNPTKDPQCHADKLEWIWANLPTWIHRQYNLTPRKWALAHPGVILFDDHITNCEAFINNGGDALLVPRPWNPDHMKDTDSTLNNCLNILKLETPYE